MHSGRFHIATLLACVCAALSLTIEAAALPLTIYNTGVDNALNAWAGAGVPDIHYSLIVQPGSATAVTVNDTTWPFPPWLANNYTANAGSRWIGPAADSNGPGGNYVYRTTFVVPSNAILSTVSVAGSWAVDDVGTDIRINGISTGQTYNSFAALAPFSINSGFVLGVNTLDFYISNAFIGNNPTGLRVDKISGNYLIPEPTSVCLVGLAALAGGRMLRRARRSDSPRH